MPFLNVAFYQFVPLDQPSQWASRLGEGLSPLDIRGTLLLAGEGYNGFLAGPEAAVRRALEFLRSHTPFAAIEVKESYSDHWPFGRLTIKVKPEIVTFRQTEVVPTAAPRITATELDALYASGEEFVLLDTRNEYESRVGSFRGATTLPIKHFVELPKAVAALPTDWRRKKVITYCTGGIRCEKAAPHLRELGYDAYQLDGGILRYLEHTAGSNWEGECFVFDQRVALNSSLEPTGATLCKHCQGPVPMKLSSCPHCGGGRLA